MLRKRGLLLITALACTGAAMVIDPDDYVANRKSKGSFTLALPVGGQFGRLSGVIRALTNLQSGLKQVTGVTSVL
ncbi:hypothetical protein [Spirosoma utsteinense]|uniref:Uncharacterized protein n=1 Tax=Spirosoma utsteinense TaxID=2585773 RepID=A0ABR6WD95_9BACT|nr:hypothetical protein [Spirosoma utsteinense]MBC3787440.1 hypothetical protein [Spirosoma utsteinense]MBC3794540.1 hypothetical protein [Spirosoma utsteinense]